MAFRAISRVLLVMVLVAFTTTALIAFDDSQASPQAPIGDIDWEAVLAQLPLTEFGDLGFNETEQKILSWASYDISDAQEYRYGSDTALPATLDEGGTRVNRIGAVQIQFDMLDFHGSPDFPPNGTITDDNVYMQSGLGPQVGVPITLFFATFERPYIAEPMVSYVNQGFLVTFPGAPGWVSEFMGDTWTGTWRAPTMEGDGNGYRISNYRFDPDASNPFPIDQCDCFAVLHGNIFVMGIPSHQLTNTVGDYDIMDMRFGFHLHHHDGTFGAPANSSSYVTTYPAVPGSRTYDDFLRPMTYELITVGTTTAPEPTPKTMTTVETSTTTTVSSSTASTAPATAGGSTTSDDEVSTCFPWWILILIGLILFAVGFWLWGWPRLFGGGEGETESGSGEEEDDDGDDPRDTPPPTTYGEVIERLQCDWAVYFDDKNQGLVPLRKPLAGMECCKYVIRVSTDIILHEQAARGRQDAGDGRLRMPDFDYAWDMLDLSAHGSARSGPFGRQDWMHGYGDPIDQSLLASESEYLQRFQGEEPPEVAVHLYHREETTVSVDLEAGCPEYDNEFNLAGSAELHMLATQECTNDDPAPQCPVELTSGGWFIGRIGGDLSADVFEENLGDLDDLERGADQPKWHEMSHQHVDNLAQEKPTYTFSTSDSDSDTLSSDSTKVTVYSSALADVGILVPVDVWSTTERVSAHLEGKLHYGIDVDGTMTPKNCETNGCGGHGDCLCRPNFKLNITTGTATITVDGKVHQIRRDPPTANRNNPPPTTEEKWVLA